MRTQMLDVSKCKPPSQSAVLDRVSGNDFLDCYCIEAESTPRQASNVITDFPEWAVILLGIRRIVTTPFGLMNDVPEADDKIGAFPVETENEHELIAGFDDKHLNFRISVLSLDGKVYLATWVRPHNLAGRAYLSMIMPFHILIARNGLARVKNVMHRNN